MKKFLLLPLTAVVLTACSSSSPAPVVSASNSRELPRAITLPVDNSTSAGSGWQTAGVQPMPTLNTPTLSTPTPSAPTLNTQTVNRPTLNQPVVNPVITEPAEPTTTTKIVKRTKTVEKKVDQNFEIPRDENNAPLYSQIKKGFYDGSTYTVRKGDTMFLIAYIIGKDVREIATLNNMSEPYQLNVGQKLKTGKSATETITVEEKVTVKVQPEITHQPGANGTIYSSDGTITGPVKAGTESSVPSSGVKASVGSVGAVTATTASVASTASSASSGGIVATTATAATTATTTASPVKVNASNTVSSAPRSSIKWQWPTKGRVAQGFSYAEGGNKGLDIVGQKGQEVRAAAAGKVVYAGNALEGYGNLIIIKHTDDN